MKKLILFYLLLQISTKSYSQAYVPFPTDSAYWLYYCNGINVDCGGSDNVAIMLFLNGEADTVNGITYNILLQRQVYCTNTPMPIQLIATNPDFFAGLVREENKIVYFLGPLQTTEQVLFDYNLQVGDTIPNMYPNYITLISTATFDNGISYPAFQCSNNTEYLEGIGGSWGILPHSYDIPIIFNDPNADDVSAGSRAQFSCFSNTYTHTNYSPYYASGCNYIYPMGTPTAVITPGIINEIKAYPNPFTNELNIAATAQGEAMLYNNSGQCVLRQKLNGAGIYPINDVARLPAGLYYLIVRDNKGNVLKKEELSKL